MAVFAIIPARFGSTRLPGKPLQIISGLEMVERVRRIASAVKNIDEVFVATDDARICKTVEGYGGKAIMTPLSCQNGSERAFEAVKDFAQPCDIIINLQGDAPLTPPWIVESIAKAMVSNQDLKIADVTEVANDILHCERRICVLQ